MKKLLFLILFVLPFKHLLCQEVSKLSKEQITQSIDSLNALRAHKSLSDAELIDIVSKIRKLKSILYSRRTTKHKFPNLDSIDVKIRKNIDELWEYSLSPKISLNARDSIYSVISKHQYGLEQLIENINTFIFEPEEGQFEELFNYPVFLFLMKNPSMIYFDYLNEKICDETYQDKVDNLIFAAVNSVKSNGIAETILNDYMQYDCISQNQLAILKSHLNSMK
ncbi:MAG: hypothetical protein P1U56_02540 [Saprospiraceae bacterium]|nr:hypothetical protein [Saprospiraceae bacterium]